MLSYLYVPREITLKYDEDKGLIVKECDCKKSSGSVENVKVAGLDLKLILYILGAIVVLKLLRII